MTSSPVLSNIRYWFQNILSCLSNPSPRPPTCILPTCILLPLDLNSFLATHLHPAPSLAPLPKPAQVLASALCADLTTSQDFLLAPGWLLGPACLLIPASTPTPASWLLLQPLAPGSCPWSCPSFYCEHALMDTFGASDPDQLKTPCLLITHDLDCLTLLPPFSVKLLYS